MSIIGYMACGFTEDDVVVENFDTEAEALDFVKGFDRNLICPVVDVKITED